MQGEQNRDHELNELNHEALCEALSVDVAPRRTTSICLNEQETPMESHTKRTLNLRAGKQEMRNGRLKSLFESTRAELL